MEFNCAEHAMYQAQSILAATITDVSRALDRDVARLTDERMGFTLSTIRWRLRAMSGALDALRGFGVEA